MGLPAVVLEAPASLDVTSLDVTSLDVTSLDVTRPDLAPKPARSSGPSAELSDFRLRALMSETDWASLPSAIRRRFSRRLAGGQSIVFAGEILESRMSRAGWWLAQAARLIGGPLPLARSAHLAN